MCTSDLGVLVHIAHRRCTARALCTGYARCARAGGPAAGPSSGRS